MRTAWAGALSSAVLPTVRLSTTNRQHLGLSLLAGMFGVATFQPFGRLGHSCCKPMLATVLCCKAWRLLHSLEKAFPPQWVRRASFGTLRSVIRCE